jgi:1-acyl-sn-glycerol-3-phosphate acyltransferase
LRLIQILLWPLRIIYILYAALLFIVFMFVVFPVVFIASFWGKVRGGNFIYDVLRMWSWVWLKAIFIFHRNIYEEKPDPSRQYIFVANHISLLDAAIIVEAIRQHFRPLGKIEMKNIPVFGFIYKVCVVMVDRSSATHRARSVRQLKSVLNKKISILVFPEGTFNLTNEPLKEFYDGAFRIAVETQTPLQPILFLDNYDRMRHQHIFSFTPGRCRTVFLKSIPVEGYTMNDIPQLKSKVFGLMSEKLRLYKASWIQEPAGDKTTI